MLEKVLIFGNPGTGKSTLAQKLGKRHNLPVFHLDKLFWLPNWMARPKSEMAIDVQKIIDTHTEWVIEGNYKRVVLESRIQSADLVLILDFNRLFCLYRVAKRNFLYLNKKRPDMAEGCKERWILDLEFFRYLWRCRKGTLEPMGEVLKKFPDKKVITFKTQREVNRWLNTI